MKVGLFYRLIVRDKKGNITSETKWRECKSFVRNFLKILGQQLGVNSSGVDIGGTTRAFVDHAENFNSDAADDDDTLGILVGTGTTAQTNTDYVIETIIAHGVGAGQLDYEIMQFTEANVVGANVDLITYRDFINSSGATINVTEVCYYVLARHAGGQVDVCIIREVFTATAVPNGQTLTVEFTWRTTA